MIVKSHRGVDKMSTLQHVDTKSAPHPRTRTWEITIYIATSAPFDHDFDARLALLGAGHPHKDRGSLVDDGVAGLNVRAGGV